MIKRTDSSWRRIRLGLILALVIASAAGCGAQPRAPALQKESIYQNSDEGLRFQIPDGWTQTAKANVPSGKHEKERLLVRLNRSTPTNPANLEVTLADLPPDTNMRSYLVTDKAGNPGWQLTDPAEELTINGVPATRWILHPPAGSSVPAIVKEIVVFRRGERSYFFTARLPIEDSKARGEVRQAVQSVIWN